MDANGPPHAGALISGSTTKNLAPWPPTNAARLALLSTNWVVRSPRPAIQQTISAFDSRRAMPSFTAVFSAVLFRKGPGPHCVVRFDGRAARSKDVRP